MQNSTNNIIFYYKENDFWKFCGNGIILDDKTIVSAAHIFEECGPLAISSADDLKNISLIDENDYIYRNRETTYPNQITIDDLMVIKNRWFSARHIDLCVDSEAYGKDITINGFNLENTGCLNSKIIKTKIVTEHSKNTMRCKYDEEMQPGISGSPVFKNNGDFIGIFISGIAECKLGVFLKSSYIISKL